MTEREDKDQPLVFISPLFRLISQDSELKSFEKLIPTIFRTSLSKHQHLFHVLQDQAEILDLLVPTMVRKAKRDYYEAHGNIIINENVKPNTSQEDLNEEMSSVLQPELRSHLQERGVDWILHGTVAKIGQGKVRLDVYLLDVDTFTLLSAKDVESTLDNFTNQVESVARSILEEFEKILAEKTQGCGSLVSKQCDRKRQIREFRHTFLDAANSHPTAPQFYFIYGNELEGHESFSERLKHEILIPFVENNYERNRADVMMKAVSWPDKGDLDQRKRELEDNILSRFITSYPIGENSAQVLSRLDSVRHYQIVIINHDIHPTAWDTRNEKELINWYIKEWWAQLDETTNVPQFLVFLYVKLPQTEAKGWISNLFNKSPEKQIKSQLQEIVKNLKYSEPCNLLAELNSISEKHVRDWFKEHNFNKDTYDEPIRRNRKIAQIFTLNDKKVTQRSMAEIEIELEKIQRELCQ